MMISADAGRATALAKYAAPRTIPAPKAVMALATHLPDSNRLVPQQKSPAMRRSGEMTIPDQATLRKAVIQVPIMITGPGNRTARKTQEQPNRKTTAETATAA